MPVLPFAHLALYLFCNSPLFQVFLKDPFTIYLCHTYIHTYVYTYVCVYILLVIYPYILYHWCKDICVYDHTHVCTGNIRSVGITW